MRHLEPEELAEALEGGLDRSRALHLATCAECRTLADEMAVVLREARAVPGVEPAPVFWERFSARVHDAIAFEAAPGRTAGVEPERRRWFSIPVLAPLAGLAVALFALAVGVSRDAVVPRSEVDSPPPTSAVVDTALDHETTWAVVSDLVGLLDVDTAREAGIATTLGTADHVALELTALEQEELVRLLRQELQRVGS